MVVLATTFALAAPVTDAPAASSAWSLLWSIDPSRPANAYVGGPDDLGFPIRHRVLTDAEGDALVFFDDRGERRERVALNPAEDLLVAEDGSAWVTWTRNLMQRSVSTFRYYRRGVAEPVWEASALGRPILMSSDGTLFVVAANDAARDEFGRVNPEGGGQMQIVDASGQVRVELPLVPRAACFTGDESRIVVLANRELLALDRAGTVAWGARVSVDQSVRRGGQTPLAAARNRIVVAGTGARQEAHDAAFHAERRGEIFAFDDGGGQVWTEQQGGDEGLWFQLAPAISTDGRTVATLHSDGGFLHVRARDGESGQVLWAERVSRETGKRHLSVSPDGEYVALTHGSHVTRGKVWSRAGELVWSGQIPLASDRPVLRADGLLIADRWIVRLAAEDEGA